MMEVLASTVVVIVLQYISVHIKRLYVFNLHNVIYQLYLIEAENKIKHKTKSTVFLWVKTKSGSLKPESMVKTG